MNQVFKFIYVSIGIIVLNLNLHAQTEFGAYFLDNTWAARELNPSDSLKGNIEVYLPGVYFESHHSNKISLSDIIEDNGSSSSTLNLQNVISQLDDKNTLDNNFKINTIGIGFKLNGFHVDVKHNLRLNSQLGYPRELAKLIFEGNAQYIGESVSFGPSVDYYSYHEYSVGVSRRFGDLNLGARIKYLSGIGFVQTDNNEASLFTSDDIYQLTFDTDYSIQASNTLSIDGVSDFTFNSDFANNFFSANNGLAFDFGLTYQVTEALSLSASIIDLGAINWDEETFTYRSNGNFTYEGFDLDAFLLDDDIEFEVKLDTLEEVFAFANSSSEAKTELGGKIYIAGQYQINEKIQVGGLFHSSDLGFDDLAYGLNAQYKLNKSSLIGLNYGYRKDSYSNLGFQFVTRIGPVAIFANTDNIISVFLNDNYSLNGRLGLGLSF